MFQPGERIMFQPGKLNEICGNCGFTFGSHNASAYYSECYKMYIPSNYCPGHEGGMDWDGGQGTTFEPTGKYKEKED